MQSSALPALSFLTINIEDWLTVSRRSLQMLKLPPEFLRQFFNHTTDRHPAIRPTRGHQIEQRFSIQDLLDQEAGRNRGILINPEAVVFVVATGRS